MIAKEEIKHKVDFTLQESSVTILKELSFISGKHYKFLCSKKDQIRLFNLFVWSDRLGLSLYELLSALWSYWITKLPPKRFPSFSVLCGPKSYVYIKLYVSTKYPSGENWEMRKQAIMEKVLEPSIIEECDDAEEYIKQYKKNILKARKQDADIAIKYKRRAWRGNPWK